MTAVRTYRVIGIDPGAGGAIALLDGDTLVRAYDMPTHLVRVGVARAGRVAKKRRKVDADSLAQLIRKIAPAQAFGEAVHSMPHDGSVGAFSFGESAGIVKGVLAALGIPTTYITPVQWKGAMHVRASEDARVRAGQLFPGSAQWWPLIKHEGRAEAAMIALYGVRTVVAPGSIEW